VLKDCVLICAPLESASPRYAGTKHTSATYLSEMYGSIHARSDDHLAPVSPCARYTALDKAKLLRARPLRTPTIG
jgi:hypothetical protein